MASLIRSAKSGSDWGRNELLAYHISVAPIPPQEFFRQEADPPLTGLDPALLNSPLDLDDANMSDDTYRFLAYLTSLPTPVKRLRSATSLVSFSA